MRFAVGWLCAGMLVAACTAAPAADRADAPDPQGSLTASIGREPETIDPQRVDATEQIKVVLMVYEGLLKPDPTTLRPAPAAADLPTVSADGRTYTFKVRPGQTYSDGAPLTARDFAYGLSRLCDPQIGATYGPVAFVIAGCGEWAGLDPAKETPQRLQAARDALFERGLRVKGDHELEISLTRPAAYLPSFFALWVSAPVRERDVLRGGETWWTDPALYVGNGPFVLSERVTDERLVFVPNTKARVPPKLARWTILLYPKELSAAEWQARGVEAYRRDEADIVWLGPFNLPLVEQDEALKAQVTEVSRACTSFVRFATSLPPFDDPKVRLALAKSVDREAFARVEGLRSRPATSLIPPGIPGHDASDQAQRFDPEAARRLLAASAYSAGRFPATPWPYLRPGVKATNEWLAAQWKEHLGIEIVPELVPLGTHNELSRRAETYPRLVRAGWCADYPDQQNWLSTLFHSKSSLGSFGICPASTVGCPTSYSSRTFDGLVEQADALTDQARRDALYLQASRLLSADAPAIWLGYSTEFFLKKSWVRGLNLSAIDDGGYFHPEDVYVVKRRP